MSITVAPFELTPRLLQKDIYLKYLHRIRHTLGFGYIKHARLISKLNCYSGVFEGSDIRLKLSVISSHLSALVTILFRLIWHFFFFLDFRF
jgi:hypothetical protein